MNQGIDGGVRVGPKREGTLEKALHLGTFHPLTGRDVLWGRGSANRRRVASLSGALKCGRCGERALKGGAGAGSAESL
jgi:hypothetical protein